VSVDGRMCRRLTRRRGRPWNHPRSGARLTPPVRPPPRSVSSRKRTPELRDRDRELLGDTLRRVGAAIGGRGSGEQLLHGEPHPGNVLSTRRGPLFIDVGTCQRGPVEYDLAYVPEGVAAHYPGANQDLVHQFGILMWAGVTTMRWYRDDQYPDRDYWRIEALNRLRAALDRYGLD
jgi:hypothetical protein